MGLFAHTKRIMIPKETSYLFKVCNRKIKLLYIRITGYQAVQEIQFLNFTGK